MCRGQIGIGLWSKNVSRLDKTSGHWILTVNVCGLKCVI